MLEEKLTAEQIEERVAKGAERKKRRDEERAARKIERKKIRNWLAGIEGVVYYHLRGGTWQKYPKGGICVAVRRGPARVEAAVSICARGDMYDKLQARKYAAERLETDPLLWDQTFPRLTLAAYGGRGLPLKDVLHRVAMMAAMNAVACLSKKKDREWFENQILRGCD